jgi:ribosomal protein S12 methylthiotransferase accessory factor
VRLKDSTPLEPAQALARMEHLLSLRTGIARGLSRLAPGPCEPRVCLYSVEAAPSGLHGGRSPRPSCGGAGFTVEAAKISALGELIESYCSSYIPPGALLRGSYEELSRQHTLLEPERLVLFSERQYSQQGFPFPRFTRQTVIGWVKGFSLTQGRELLVPASCVHMPYTPAPGEALLGPTLSTGLAAGDSLERAIVSGLYECFERDAFTLFWMNQLPVRRVDLGHSSGTLAVKRLFDERLAVPGYGYQVFDITNDLGVSTAYVILTRETVHGPVYVIGAASRLDGPEAVLKALLEAVQGAPYVMHLIAADPLWRPAPDFKNVESFAHTARLYTVAPELTPHLLSVSQRVSAEVPLEALPRWESSSPTATIESLVSRLAARGYEAVVVDLTTSDIAALGMKVVRVLTPELHPLHGIHRFPFLGGKRLYEVPVRLGHRPTAPTEAELNPYPHPFP